MKKKKEIQNIQDVRDKIIHVRTSKYEREEIEDFIKKNGFEIALSTFIRSTILDHVRGKKKGVQVPLF